MEELLKKSDFSYDIIVLTETWLIPDIADCEVVDDRYTVFRCDRDRAATGKREGGGVLVAILKTLQPLYMVNVFGSSLHTHLEFLLIQLPSRDRAKRHFISAVYIPPKTADDVYISYLGLLSNILSDPVIDCFYIVGDFTLIYLNWNGLPVLVNATSSVRLGHLLVGIWKIFFLNLTPRSIITFQTRTIERLTY